MVCLTWLLQREKCRRLIQIAEKCLEEATNYFYGIEACSEVLDGYVHDVGPMLKCECLCLRAALLLQVIPQKKEKKKGYLKIKLLGWKCSFIHLIFTLFFFPRGSGKMMLIWP